jgi:transposase
VLGATSPLASWTRDPASTPNCCHERASARRARILEFDDEGFSRRHFVLVIVEETYAGLYERCAGLDVHKDNVVARVRCVSEPKCDEVRSFATTTSALLDLKDWLASHAVTHLAMEATGVYWKPVWHLLEDEFELILANAHHIRNVPGRKSDVNDATWIADLLAHGLIRSSFVPPQPIQELRDLTRTRKQLVREISQHSSRIQKVLEDANLKLGSVLSDVLGKAVGPSCKHSFVKVST